MKSIRAISFLMMTLMLTSVFASCVNIGVLGDTDTTEDTVWESELGSQSESPVEKYLNGVSIDDYTIIYSADDVDYSMRAAEYIQDEVEARTGFELDVRIDTDGPFDHEIVVGETSRSISKELDPETQALQFAIFANDSHIAMEGDYFVIAAAAYFFIETYVADEDTDVQIPKEVSVHDPIVKEAKNFILLIGDGMGVNQTRLFEAYDVATEGDKAYSDGEDFFYGYMLPYYGLSVTTSLSGVTDSAAGGTALATGYKTYNSRVGRDKEGNDIQSLTELAGSKGMATAVITTDSADGATPASFSAHADNRNDSDVIKESQNALKLKYDTIINSGSTKYSQFGIISLESRITKTLNRLSADEDGFFLMYEEAHIDKHSHSSEMEGAFDAVVRFNQAIGRFMEYAFYNPDTFVLITADHETGGLVIDENGEFSYTSAQNSNGSRNHTGAAVPVFAYGMGAELFNDTTVENVEIPKQIAKLMGEDGFGGPLHAYDYFW